MLRKDVPAGSFFRYLKSEHVGTSTSKELRFAVNARSKSTELVEIYRRIAKIYGYADDSGAINGLTDWAVTAKVEVLWTPADDNVLTEWGEVCP